MPSIGHTHGISQFFGSVKNFILTADSLLSKTFGFILSADSRLFGTISFILKADSLLLDKFGFSLVADSLLFGTLQFTLTADSLLLEKQIFIITVDSILILRPATPPKIATGDLCVRGEVNTNLCVRDSTSMDLKV